ncbi:MAG TPA: GAF domain-containing protein [Terriglobales bacterium]|nr:GAF domain-containing protein [Terriglobales bacterium]
MERRRHLRHRVHSPAYASVGTGAGGVVLDANERGVAIESVARLVPQSFVDLRLDLLETRSSAVTPARVAWCDASRAGLEFLNLTGESRRQLQQWLLLNVLLVTDDARALTQGGRNPVHKPDPVVEQATDPAAFDMSRLAQEALLKSSAHGAAIALAERDLMLCRATAGEIAPPPGTRLDAESGISGACVRSGRWLRCDDPQLDPHVDRESCRMLGINSVLAVPIGERGNVLGLIEVFSRQLYAFNETHCAALQELARTIALSLRPQATPATPSPAPLPQPVEEATRPASAEPAPATTPTPAAQVSASPTVPAVEPSDENTPPAESSGRQRTILLGMLVAVVIIGLWFALNRGSGGAKNVDAATPALSNSAQETQAAAQGESKLPDSMPAAEVPSSLHDLLKRARAGDAEAEFELGARYAGGDEVRQDYSEAVKWFTRSAEGGQVLAAATLGAYYWAGRGVSQDDVSAYMWSAIAKDGGDEASKYRLAILRARMTAGEVAEGEQRAAAWRKNHTLQPLVRSTAESSQP